MSDVTLLEELGVRENVMDSVPAKASSFLPMSALVSNINGEEDTYF